MRRQPPISAPQASSAASLEYLTSCNPPPSLVPLVWPCLYPSPAFPNPAAALSSRDPRLQGQAAMLSTCSPAMRRSTSCGAQRAALLERLRHGREADVGAASTSSKPMTERSSGTAGRPPGRLQHADGLHVGCREDGGRRRSASAAAPAPRRAASLAPVGAARGSDRARAATPASASAAAKPSRRRALESKPNGFSSSSPTKPISRCPSASRCSAASRPPATSSTLIAGSVACRGRSSTIGMPADFEPRAPRRRSGRATREQRVVAAADREPSGRGRGAARGARRR